MPEQISWPFRYLAEVIVMFWLKHWRK